MWRGVLCAALLLAALPWSAGAQAGRTLAIERFHSDIRVLESGEIDVIETIRFRFDGSWNGVFRNLSLRHETADGDRERLRIDVRSVADAAGNPLEYESSRQDGWTRQLKIWVPGAEDTTGTVVIHYTVENALRYFDADSTGRALDELYWQVTGTEWEPTIERASARVLLPDSVEPLQTAAYTGYADSGVGDATVDVAGNVVAFEALQQLSPGQGLTVAVGWPGGVVHRPTAAERAVGTAQGNWPLLLPPLAFFLVFRRWRRRGRDPERQSVAVQYEPPDGMSPAELGTLVDHKAEIHDVTATLVDLAVRGYVAIEEQKESALFGLVSDTEYVFHLRKPRLEWDLAPHERAFLTALFKNSSPIGVAGSKYRERSLESVKLSDLKNSFYKDLSEIRNEIYHELMRRGYYRDRPDHVKLRWIAGAIVLVVASFMSIAFIDESGFAGLNAFAVGAAGIIIAVILLGFGLVMPARTIPGTRALERALGFKEFLDRVETDRYRRMITSPELFERFLPHAMAFGVEDRWARAFEDLYTQPPEWYYGSSNGAFRASAFSHSLHQMSQEAGTTMASSPGSSGSGGGGSVGGGSGGGGGGGF